MGQAIVGGSLLAIGLGGSAAGAVESDPLPVPTGGARQRAVTAYNTGVKLMVEKHYAAAQQKFEEALAADERLAEAHNNLAFSLRMQGPHNQARALKHYDRALELKPDLARAYMYRGALFTQMGDLARARADHATLSEAGRAPGGQARTDHRRRGRARRRRRTDAPVRLTVSASARRASSEPPRSIHVPGTDASRSSGARCRSAA